jgi:hypothetical protein
MVATAGVGYDDKDGVTMWAMLFIVLVGAATDFVIVAGAALSAAMVNGQSVALPSLAVWILVVAGGLVAAARSVKAAIEPAIAEQLRARTGPPRTEAKTPEPFTPWPTADDD